MMNTKKIAVLSLLVISSVGQVSANTTYKKMEYSEVVTILFEQLCNNTGTNYFDTPNNDLAKQKIIREAITNVINAGATANVNKTSFVVFNNSGTNVNYTAGGNITQEHVNKLSLFAYQHDFHPKIVSLESQKQLALDAKRSAEGEKSTAENALKTAKNKDSFFPQGMKGYGFGLLALAFGGAITFVVLQSMGDKTEDDEVVQQEGLSG